MAARRRATALLAAVSETPALDADLLLAHVLGQDRAALLRIGQEPVGHDDRLRFNDLLAGRLAGEPVAYLLGRKDFRGITLLVNPQVLIPRPETEQLVEIALAWLRRRRLPLRVADVGSGSGAVALALAHETTDLAAGLKIVALDVSPEALSVLAHNRAALGLDRRVDVIESDLLAAVPGTFDLLLANLPYLRSDQRHPSTAREPARALFGGTDGFDVYRRFLPQAARSLRDGGLIVIEIDPSQAELGARIAETSTGLPVEVRNDLAGRARFLLIGAAG